MSFTNKTLAYKTIGNYQVPMYFSTVQTGSFRTNLNLRGTELRNMALNVNQLSAQVSRWQGPGYFYAPISNSMDNSATPTYFDARFLASLQFYTERYIGTKHLGLTRNFYASASITNGYINSQVLGWNIVIDNNTTTTDYFADRDNNISDAITIFSNMATPYTVYTKEIYQFDLTTKSNFYFSSSVITNQLVDVNSLNPGAPICCTPKSESVGLPGIFKTLDFYKNNQTKILWQFWDIIKSTTVTPNNFSGFGNDTNTSKNFFNPVGSGYLIPQPLIFATASSSYQTSKMCDVYVFARSPSEAGQVQFTSSLGRTEITIPTTGIWVSGTLEFPTENILNPLNIDPSWLNTSGSININYRKLTNAFTASFMQISAIIISERA